MTEKNENLPTDPSLTKILARKVCRQRESCPQAFSLSPSEPECLPGLELVPAADDLPPRDAVSTGANQNCHFLQSSSILPLLIWLLIKSQRSFLSTIGATSQCLSPRFSKSLRSCCFPFRWPASKGESKVQVPKRMVAYLFFQGLQIDLGRLAKEAAPQPAAAAAAASKGPLQVRGGGWHHLWLRNKFSPGAKRVC